MSLSCRQALLLPVLFILQCVSVQHGYNVTICFGVSSYASEIGCKRDIKSMMSDTSVFDNDFREISDGCVMSVM